MKRFLFAVAIVSLFASGAYAVQFPADGDDLTLYYPGTGALTYNVDYTQVDMLAVSDQVGLLAAYTDDADFGFDQDYTLWTTLHYDQSNLTELGLLARGNVGMLTVYEASVQPEGYYVLQKIIGGGTMVEFGSSKIQIPNFDTTKDYLLGLSVSGNVVGTKLYQVNGENLDYVWGFKGVDNMMGGIPALTGTQFGLLGFQHGENIVSGSFLNSSIGSYEALPEPGTVAMLIAAGLGMLGWAGLRRRG